jgi:hypothetical protein
LPSPSSRGPRQERGVGQEREIGASHQTDDHGAPENAIFDCHGAENETVNEIETE